MIQKFLIAFIFCILSAGIFERSLLACRSCSCLISHGAELEHPAIDDATWTRMQDFYSGNPKFAFPRLFSRMMADREAKQRIAQWKENSPNHLDGVLVGRHYEIPARVKAGFQFIYDKNENRITATLNDYNPANGEGVPEDRGERTRLILRAMTTFGYLLFRWVEENPQAEFMTLGTVQIETDEMMRTLERFGFEKKGSGLILQIKKPTASEPLPSMDASATQNPPK